MRNTGTLIKANFRVPENYVYGHPDKGTNYIHCDLTELLDVIAGAVGLENFLKLAQETVDSAGCSERNWADELSLLPESERAADAAKIEAAAQRLQDIAAMLDPAIEALEKAGDPVFAVCEAYHKKYGE